MVDEEKSLIGVISSTEIRRRVCENSHTPFFGITGLVTPQVIQYLTENQLYRRPSSQIDLHTLVKEESMLVTRLEAAATFTDTETETDQ